MRILPFFKKERPPFYGILEAYALPYETAEEIATFWPRLTKRQRRRMLLYESHNLVTALGIANLNAYYGSTSTVPGFSLYFAVGTGAFNGPASGDTSLSNEVYRAVPTSSGVVGNTINIVTTFSGTQGGHVGTNPVVYTNAGLFGNGASGTLGSGQLNTHAPYSFTKPYGLSINNTYRIVRT